MNEASLIKSRRGPTRGVALPGNIFIVFSSESFPPAEEPELRSPTRSCVRSDGSAPPARCAWEEQPAAVADPCLRWGEGEKPGVLPSQPWGALCCCTHRWDAQIVHDRSSECCEELMRVAPSDFSIGLGGGLAAGWVIFL